MNKYIAGGAENIIPALGESDFFSTQYSVILRGLIDHRP